MKRYISATLVIFFLLPSPSNAAGPVQLLQGKCPTTNLSEVNSKQGLPSKANALLSGLMATNQDTKTWQIVSISPLKKTSHFYKPALKACKKKVADHTYLINVLVTKKSAQLPVRMHLFATKEGKEWKIWGLTSY
ncbi:hypothetical protein GLW07_15670 [Bacillus hwajinpoensis]|uniref:DUF4829 domain-containing protein n=1 Tax=Guptibacillus hwajinpoensis TaxID=208199 RepID=A0A845F290_9BACL|nr:hypothetical protein [Pseudalkalibacillus hwajinpoensis]MYL64796.1 hypothetical protein [Pseudalkalibacillus hwajinpoensis]